MRKVLMICGSFPPESDVGGLRPAMFSKYLPQYGWEPYIYTSIRPKTDSNWCPMMEIDGLPPPDRQFKILFGEEHQKAFLKIRGKKVFRDFFCPDYAHPPGWVEKMIDGSNSPFFKQAFDAIFTTVPDLGSLTVARYLSNRINVPWIADFRDIQEQDRTTSFRDCIFFWRMIIRRLFLLRASSSVITVSDHHARMLRKQCRKIVHIIHNGFDPEMYPKISKQYSPIFSITYVGRILNTWLQNPFVLFDALDCLYQTKPEKISSFSIDFFGTEPLILENLLKNHTCKKIVHANSRIPFREVPKKLSQSCILLLLTNKHRHGILTTKLFEYMGARRPILCIPGDGGELDNILRETQTGVSCPTVESAVGQIQKWCIEWEKTGTVQWNGNDEKLIRFTRKYQARQLAEVLDKVTSE